MIKGKSDKTMIGEGQIVRQTQVIIIKICMEIKKDLLVVSKVLDMQRGEWSSKRRYLSYVEILDLA